MTELKPGTKVLDVSGWVDVRRDKRPLKGCGTIEPLIGQFTRKDGFTDISVYDRTLWKLRGYKLKWTMTILDLPVNRKEDEYSPTMPAPRIPPLNPKVGAEISYEGWADLSIVPWELDDGTVFDDNVCGLYVRKNGASNIANYDHYLEHLNGHKLQVTMEILDVPENRPPEEAPLDKRGGA